MLALFAEAFEDEDSYASQPPGDDYIRRLLASGAFFALIAAVDSVVVGAVAAAVLHKFEQQRSEIHIYDLAVAQAHRRQGVATALIRRLQEEAASRGALSAASPPLLHFCAIPTGRRTCAFASRNPGSASLPSFAAPNTPQRSTIPTRSRPMLSGGSLQLSRYPGSIPCSATRIW
jgi:GNAT superfamily N-acetyltransferase